MRVDNLISQDLHGCKNTSSSLADVITAAIGMRQVDYIHPAVLHFSCALCQLCIVED